MSHAENTVRKQASTSAMTRDSLAKGPTFGCSPVWVREAPRRFASELKKDFRRASIFTIRSIEKPFAR